MNGISKTTRIWIRIFRIIILVLFLGGILYWSVLEFDKRLEEPSFWRAAFSVPTYIFLFLVLFGMLWLIITTFKKK